MTALAQAFNKMASDLETRASALAASDEARRQLLADVSHELMTPLTAIRGYVQTLAMPHATADESARQRYLSIIDQETYKLNDHQICSTSRASKVAAASSFWRRCRSPSSFVARWIDTATISTTAG